MNGNASFRERWRHIIFGTDSPAGRLFDQILIALILLSVVCVVIDSVSDFHDRYENLLYMIEWAFTIIFTLEYVMRLYVSQSPKKYARSFFGIIDIISILPTYLSLIMPGANYLLIVRLLRALRIFRVFKLLHFSEEAQLLVMALSNAKRKILVFLYSVTLLTMVYGTLMYLIEGPENGFSSIPKSVYWAIVTLTTVGYGDIAPHTAMGQGLAALVMLTGYAILAVPTGIVTAEITLLGRDLREELTGNECPSCHNISHGEKVFFCSFCGTELKDQKG